MAESEIVADAKVPPPPAGRISMSIDPLTGVPIVLSTQFHSRSDPRLIQLPNVPFVIVPDSRVAMTSKSDPEPTCFHVSSVV